MHGVTGRQSVKLALHDIYKNKFTHRITFSDFT